MIDVRERQIPMKGRVDRRCPRIQIEGRVRKVADHLVFLREPAIELFEAEQLMKIDGRETVELCRQPADIRCRNKSGRAAIRISLSRTGHAVTLVPVAAILVASIRLNFLGPCTDVRRGGPRTTLLDVPLEKGEEMGWFQHGSTIVVFAPDGFTLVDGVQQGRRIRMGEPLMRVARTDGRPRSTARDSAR